MSTTTMQTDACSDSSCSHSHTHDAHADGRPRRAILTKEDLERFQTSGACSDFVQFISSLNDSVRNKTLQNASAVASPAAESILHMLDALDAWTSDIPPDDNAKSRFGNPAFQKWFDRLEAHVESLVYRILPETVNLALFSDQNATNNPTDAHEDARSAAVTEIATYLLHSFGNRKRIDYGTGHEAHFIAFLLCLEKLGVTNNDDHPALVLKVFWRYIGVMRTLQFRYWLEPAGSHGVWGLDDYHFLPFMFGSSQLSGHKYLRPKSIHDKDIVEEFSKDYMYLACIGFINAVKTSASLRWHSPMLDDISGVKTWEKVNQGMMKMYKAEVLGKLPIMQHFLFGKLIRFEGGSEFDPSVASDHHGHDHVHAFGQLRPDCCGMRIPSAIGAAVENKTQFRKPIPFD